MEALTDPRVVGALGLMVLLTVAPGPDMALVMSTAVRSGRRAAIRTSLGISTVTIAWATLTVVHVRRALGATTGAVLVAFGVRAAAEPA